MAFFPGTGEKRPGVCGYSGKLRAAAVAAKLSFPFGVNRSITTKTISSKLFTENSIDLHKKVKKNVLAEYE